MADLGTARPVSGEMMTAAGRRSSGSPRRDEVIDAEYVEVEAVTRPVGGSPTTSDAVPERPGMGMLIKRGGGVPHAARGGPLFWLAGAMVAAAAFWTAGGHGLVRGNLPLAADQASPRLTISDVRSRAEAVEGQIVLLVDGVIRNEGEASGRVPALIVHVLSSEGKSANYRLGTLRTPLAPEAKYSFSSRLDMPKDGVKTVTVTFDE